MGVLRLSAGVPTLRTGVTTELLLISSRSPAGYMAVSLEMHFGQCLYSLGLLPQDFQTENDVVVGVVAKGFCDLPSYHSHHHPMN